MDSWEAKYDDWKTAAPEPQISKIECAICKSHLYCGDTCYEIEGDYYCEDCAQEWLEEQRFIIDEDSDV